MRSLEVPSDLQDGAAWDTYWENHLKVGFGPPLFDMLIHDQDLVGVMRTANLSTVLCVGNGMSMEPRALAAAGFAVTALDVAPRVTSFASRVPLDDEYIARLIGEAGQRPGGHASFVTGDVFDAAVCPGPYDVVIERRTAQNYAADDRIGAFLAGTARRLANRGVFVSHAHDARWQPGRQPQHLPGEWFASTDWTIWPGSVTGVVEGRVAWLLTSTG